MRTFAIELSSEDASERIDDVVSFVGADASGSFGILSNRQPLATTLVWGLCSLGTSPNDRECYLAVPGGVLYFAGNVLHICARRYLRDDDPARIVRRLDEEMRSERDVTRDMHDLLNKLDRELVTRLLTPS